MACTDPLATQRLIHRALSFAGNMAGTTGLEPATSAVTGQRSNQLNYVPRVATASLTDGGRSRI